MSEFTRHQITDTYFQVDRDGKTYPNAVLIDMEPKVVEKCLKASEDQALWSFNPKFSYTKQHGSGNNWALGYKLFDEAEYGDEVVDKIRLMLERVDYFGGFLVF